MAALPWVKITAFVGVSEAIAALLVVVHAESHGRLLVKTWKPLPRAKPGRRKTARPFRVRVVVEAAATNMRARQGRAKPWKALI
jgi:hypothetical protein